jgi:hypothetical protein
MTTVTATAVATPGIGWSAVPTDAHRAASLAEIARRHPHLRADETKCFFFHECTRVRRRRVVVGGASSPLFCECESPSRRSGVLTPTDDASSVNDTE